MDYVHGVGNAKQAAVQPPIAPAFARYAQELRYKAEAAGLTANSAREPAEQPIVDIRPQVIPHIVAVTGPAFTA